MELEFLDFHCVSDCLCKEYLLVVATDEVPPNHSLRLANDFELTIIKGCLHNAVIELNDQHVLLVVSELARQKLDVLNLVTAEAPGILLRIFWGVLYGLILLILRRYKLQFATEKKEGRLMNVLVLLTRLFHEFQPGVRLEAHKSVFILSANQNHDVTICLLRFTEELLFDHLRVIDEADKLPLAKVNDPLWHRQGHMYNRNFLVRRATRLICKQRVVNDIVLHEGLLRIVHRRWLLAFSFVVSRGDEVQSDHVAAVLLVDYAANKMTLLRDHGWVHVPELSILPLLRPHEVLIEVEPDMIATSWLLNHLLYLLLLQSLFLTLRDLVEHD